MNLFELQERLKDFSQDQLVREMQAPTGTAPQYLVLSELQRRQRMMAQEQAQMPQDQTTVAQDALAAAGMPQGGLADMAQAMAPRTDMDMNTGVAPVPQMRDGGVVRMQPGGLAGVSRDLRAYYPTMGGARAIDPYVESTENVFRKSYVVDAAIERAERAKEMLRALEEERRLREQSPPLPPALAGVSQNIQGFSPPDPSMDSDVSSLLGIDPLVSGSGFPSRPAPIQPTDFAPVFNPASMPPSIRGFGRPEQGPNLPPAQGPTDARRGRLVRMPDTGEVFVQLPDGSLFPPAMLGISDAQMQDQEIVDLETPVPRDDSGRQQLTDLRDAELERANRILQIPEGGIEELLPPPRRRERPESEPWRDALLDTVRLLPGAGTIETVLDFAGLLPEDPGAMMDRLAQEDANKIAADRAAAGITDASDSFGALFTGGDEEGAAAVIERARDINRERFKETTSPTPPDKTPPAPRATPPAGGAPSVDDAFEQDKWLALAQAGLALMSSQQPTLGGAIGEAGLAGISALRTARGERDERIEKAQARADRLAAAASRGTQYPYRQARDLLSLADAYDGISEAILAANSNVMPSQNDPSFRDYHINRILAEQIRADVAKMALGTGMTQGSEDED
jgi:hypothetical protein